MRVHDELDNPRTMSRAHLETAGLTSGFTVFRRGPGGTERLRGSTWPIEVNVHDVDQTVSRGVRPPPVPVVAVAAR